MDKTAVMTRKGICKRTQKARLDRNWTQLQMAGLLGVPSLDTYKKWETRNPMPHEYIERFCLLTHTTAAWLIYGHVELIAETKERSFDTELMRYHAEAEKITRLMDRQLEQLLERLEPDPSKRSDLHKLLEESMLAEKRSRKPK